MMKIIFKTILAVAMFSFLAVLIGKAMEIVEIAKQEAIDNERWDNRFFEEPEHFYDERLTEMIDDRVKWLTHTNYLYEFDHAYFTEFLDSQKNIEKKRILFIEIHLPHPYENQWDEFPDRWEPGKKEWTTLKYDALSYVFTQSHSGNSDFEKDNWELEKMMDLAEEFEDQVFVNCMYSNKWGIGYELRDYSVWEFEDGRRNYHYEVAKFRNPLPNFTLSFPTWTPPNPHHGYGTSGVYNSLRTELRLEF